MSQENLSYFIAAQTGVCPLTVGIPGCAKTAIASAFAKSIGRECYTFIGSIREPSDLGLPVIDQESRCVDLLAPRWVDTICRDAEKGKFWVIFWDELTTCSPAMQAGMLRPIAEGWIGDKKLPKETIQMAAANPPGLAANGFELEPPLANRVCHLKWEMNWSAWDIGMASGLEFPDPTFPVLPKDWRLGLGETGALVAAFRNRKPGCFSPPTDEHGNPKMDRSTLGAAWPSPRSWTNAVLCLTAAVSVKADDAVQQELVEGCVGYGAAVEFFEWKRSLDLPDPEEMLHEAMEATRKKRKMDYKRPNRPDKVLAMLGSVAAAVIRNNSVDRWQAAMNILAEEAEFAVDIAAACCKPLLQAAVMPKGAAMPPAFMKTVFPAFQKIGTFENK